MNPPVAQWSLPFFDASHRALAETLAEWTPAQRIDETDDRAACKAWVRALGDAGHLRLCVPAAFGGATEKIDSRALVIARETLAFHSPLADFAFAMQGLGSGAISLEGLPTLQNALLPAVMRGEKIAAFALSEQDAGSDVAAMQTTARREGDHYVLNGVKTWISNGGIADFYCVFAKTDASAGVRGISAFVVDANAAGVDDSESIHVIAPHPLAKVRFSGVKVPTPQMLGGEGEGFKLAMRTLDIFRTSVAAAALGFARRALAESVAYAKQRKMFGVTLADFQLTQAKLGALAAELDGAALLTYRAAWLRDVEGARTTVEAAMAKMQATETAQRVIDAAVQLHGGRGVEVGSKVESLYRDIRALRIYEGATEVQQLIIGKALLQ
jgi:acyl-CoA dehydrogenase